MKYFNLCLDIKKKKDKMFYQYRPLLIQPERLFKFCFVNYHFYYQTLFNATTLELKHQQPQTI